MRQTSPHKFVPIEYYWYMIRGAASIMIDCPPQAVYDAVTDVGRTGSWSVECTGGAWVAPATGPAVGATFTGTNVAKLGPVPIKKWTTTCEVTACRPGELFEFVAEGYTTWRYEFIEIDGSTRVTESFWHDDYEGFKKLLYGTIFKRRAAMIEGMEATLATMKVVLEAECGAAREQALLDREDHPS